MKTNRRLFVCAVDNSIYSPTISSPPPVLCIRICLHRKVCCLFASNIMHLMPATFSAQISSCHIKFLVLPFSDFSAAQFTSPSSRGLLIMIISLLISLLKVPTLPTSTFTFKKLNKQVLTHGKLSGN